MQPILMWGEEISDWSSWVHITMKMKTGFIVAVLFGLRAGAVQMFVLELTKIEESDGEEE